MRSRVEVDGRARPGRLRFGGKGASASRLPNVMYNPEGPVLLRLAGIYSLEGDRMRLSYFEDGCDTGQRPTEFEPSSERHVTMTFKRVKVLR